MKPFYLLLAILPGLALCWDNDSLDEAWRQERITPLMTAAQPGEDFQALYAHYRVAMIALRNDDKKQAKRSLEIVQDALEDYQSCDEAALYAASIGLSISIKPWQAAFIAGRAEDALATCEQSQGHAPTLMVKGIASFNTPALLGGDREAALALFNDALTQYETSDAWGHEDAWLWKVKTLSALEQTASAKETWKRAQARYPDFRELLEIEP
ncbi:tetratricopeptide repeat protein [Reinekea blandensis]|uniref:TPR domain protein n=1 Tax=Reinekea blandensis MED297 TaxID=314283 RepID=A4BBZ3_9GAMM|nr:tetratricopeptide repeat protein [Reinekea blandensis]EAR10478.1 TPR domain protein [Reinekea sp. MED297] [Reinekea blandensis MED297]